MAWQYIVSEIAQYVTDDTPDGLVYRPKVSEYADNWSATDGRLDERLPDGYMLVHADLRDEAGARADRGIWFLSDLRTNQLRNIVRALGEDDSDISDALDTVTLVGRLKGKFANACGRNRKGG